MKTDSRQDKYEDKGFFCICKLCGSKHTNDGIIKHLAVKHKLTGDE